MAELVDLIQRAVEDGASGPSEVANAIAPYLDGLQEERMFELGLQHYVRSHLRRMRSTPRRVAVRTTGESNVYKTVRDAIKAGLWQVRAKDGWKQLRDCTVEDVTYIAGVHLMLAERNMKAGEKYEALARHMTERDCATVGDLIEVDGQVVDNALGSGPDVPSLAAGEGQE